MKALAFLLCCLLAGTAQALTVSTGVVQYRDSDFNSPMLGVSEGRLGLDWSRDGIFNHVGVGVAFPVYVAQGVKFKAQVGGGAGWQEWETWMPEVFLGLTAGVKQSKAGVFAGIRQIHYGGDYDPEISYSVGVSLDLK